MEHRLEDGILAIISVPEHSVKPAGTKKTGQAKVRKCMTLKEIEESISRKMQSIKSFRDSLSDIIPTVYPTRYFGESIWSGFFGSKITFSGTEFSTWSFCKEPPIKDLTQFDFPAVSPDNRWFQEILKVTQYFAENIEPICDITPFIFMDCLNLLTELRGASAAFTDIYDYPEILERFMNWSVDVNMQVFEAQANILKNFTGKVYGEHPFEKYAYSRIPNLSVDAYGMCKPDIYKKWGLEQHQRIVSHYGGGRLHIHANGRNLCEPVSRIKGLNYCDMNDDAGFPKACDIIDELKKRMSPVPITLRIPKQKFLTGLHNRTLPGGVLYKLSADSLEEANEIMRKVFEYSPQ